MIIGRKQEIKILKKVYDSKDAEFIALYGRRRIGKTFLIRQMFSKEKNYFELVGLKDGPLKEQLKNFTEALSQTFYQGLPLQIPSSWEDGFKLLTDALQKIPTNKKLVLFFDELPWLASRKSKFIQALDYYWNKYWSQMTNLKLIVCGSAAAWMIDHLINDKGGLHNRITGRILLEPFTLKEVKEFLKSRSINLKDEQIVDLYMVLGGVPYYLKFIERGESAAQIVSSLCFDINSPLRDEFPRLIKSLFDKGETHLQILRLIAKSYYGISRENLLKKLKMTSGGAFNKYIEELEAAGFIKAMRPYLKKKNYYRAIDEYSLFYLNWIEPVSTNGIPNVPRDFWVNQIGRGEYNAWAGYAYETICLTHTRQIQKALGIENQVREITSWRASGKSTNMQGAQIDLLFDRFDQSVTLCEIKYTKTIFTVDKSYAEALKKKISVFSEHFPKKQIFLALISTQGFKKNIWTEGLIDQGITLGDLMN